MPGKNGFLNLLQFVMNFWQKSLLKLISGIIAFFVLYLILPSLFFMNLTTVISPGWHTTIYPFGGAFGFTVFIVIVTLFSYLLFKYMSMFLTYIWLKIFRRHS
jgi:hypothetical protein